ncbi:MAG: DNA repair protein RadC [Candidatus Thiodiazotropha lotti]|uniref:MPN domain-containing protein n=1 Tax=Candidatus Thiodiazotropha endoloripes TaxID=1818881 RepID=A0A1E2ULS6_9GAMM|nr:DNA repair protein RadC [Candidatus Thiodiazotropha endoloripes]MCG7899360.1 DNA repair protein RadC [Candidatus Thiodiazotropha weberae]MCG7992048.1 DNA repair protein RadC [Candidatus Thiodiazotropha lotti]MCG7904436.1 DNA repair protein RadC [Candidatus Thiodiazotropha weberae]MCG7915884.1 DNA repair protein RadC [Candidatus Thiodiazotropha weberae]MCG7998552.1 DNA repair protein RadC [Candidatus Thiodiazotropha lotti]
MPITDWPCDDRPREKLLNGGAASLSDAELLAIFLRTGIKGFTAVDLARNLLSEFGGLGALLRADQSRFCQAKGMGVAKFAQIQASLEISRRYLHEQLQQNDSLTNPQQTRHYLHCKLRHYTYEVFACLFLDNRHRVICYEELFRGTIDGASVHPREVVKRALQHNAAALIFAHNHPSGVVEPSQADRAITDQLKSALALVDIRVLDHFIIGEGEPTSLAERGMI